MNTDTFLNALKIALQISGLILIVALALMIGILIIVTALYIPVKKANKYNLKSAESYVTEQRIYLDEYKYTVENDRLKEKLESKEQELKGIQDNIRKQSAELKSIEAEIAKKSGKKKD